MNTIKSMIVAAIAAAAVAIPATAHAVDKAPPPLRAAGAVDNTPGCISTREFNAAIRGTMSQVEALLEVTGQGQVVAYQQGGQYLTKQYVWCNHEARDYMLIWYSRNTRGQYMANLYIYVDWSDRGVARVTS